MADSIVNIRLSTAETQILIDLYKGHEALWDYSNKLYKSRGAKAASYRSIQLAFQAATGMLLPITVLKTKLQSFRTSFGKELNLVMRSNQTGKEAYIPKYEHYQRLTFLKGVLCQKKWKQDGQNATPTTQSTSSTQSLEEQQQHNRGVQEFTIYSSPPGHHHLNDDDDDNNNNDISENLSCDLSCDSIPDDKLMLRGLIAQNNGLAQQGLRDLSSTSHPQNTTPTRFLKAMSACPPTPLTDSIPTHHPDPRARTRNCSYRCYACRA
ncbi:uncharacterized protein LOC143275776 [Babylonia areolata]|uniref:uncharacterized protein LOC143275776 n=1 Tax=Babylonia areolata TaxID=304850 RepID=UPI003FCFD8C3